MPGTITDPLHPINVFLDRIRQVVLQAAQGPCHPRYVPQLLTRLNPNLDNRSIIDVLWQDAYESKNDHEIGDEGWKKVEQLVDHSICVYQDAHEGEVMPIWAGMTEALPGPSAKEIAKWAAADALHAAQKVEAEAIKKTYGQDMPDAELEAALERWYAATNADDCGHVAFAHWGGARAESARRRWSVRSGKRVKS